MTSFYQWPGNQDPGPLNTLWDISDPCHPEKLSELNFKVYRFSSSGQTLLSQQGTEHDLATGKLIRRIADGDRTPLGIRHISDDFKTLVSDDGIWDIPSGQLLAPLPKHSAFLDRSWESASVSPIDENLIVVGSPPGAQVLNRKGELITTIPGTSGTPIAGIDFSKDGDLLAVRQALGAIRVFDPSNWTEVVTFRTMPGDTVAFSPVVNNLFLAGCSDGIVRGYRVSPDTVPDAVLDHPDKVLNLKFTPDGRILAVGMKHGVVQFWNVQRREKLFVTPVKPKTPRSPPYRSGYPFDLVAISTDSRFAVIIGPPDTITVWDIGSKEEFQVLNTAAPPGESRRVRYKSLEFSRDGSRLFAGVSNHPHGALEVWALSSKIGGAWHRQASHPIPLHTNTSITSSPDGDILASAGYPDVMLWKLPEMEPDPNRIPFAAGAAGTNLAFSPDGSRLAITMTLPAVTIWNTSTWERTASLAHTMVPLHVSWSPDGTRLAASDRSATTKLWDIESGQVVATYRGTVAEFSPDGTTLAVGGQGSKFIGDEKLVGRVTLHYAPTLEDIDRRLGASNSASR